MYTRTHCIFLQTNGYSIFLKFKMLDGHHFGFCVCIISGPMNKLLFSNSVLPQILVQIGGMVWKLEPIFDIQDGLRSPSWIFVYIIFVFMKNLLFTKSVLRRNLAQIGGMVRKLKPFSEIQDSGRSPSWIFFTSLLVSWKVAA